MVGLRAISQHFGHESAMGFFQDFLGQLKFGQFHPDFFER